MRESSVTLEKAVLRVYDPSDPGVDWAADVLTRLADMCGEFVVAVARLLAFLVRSLRTRGVGL
jgi:hypothetical protein